MLFPLRMGIQVKFLCTKFVFAVCGFVKARNLILELSCKTEEGVLQREYFFCVFFLYFCLVCVYSQLSINVVFPGEWESMFSFCVLFCSMFVILYKFQVQKLGSVHRGFGQRVPRLYIRNMRFNFGRFIYFPLVSHLVEIS